MPQRLGTLPSRVRGQGNPTLRWRQSTDLRIAGRGGGDQRRSATSSLSRTRLTPAGPAGEVQAQRGAVWPGQGHAWGVGGEHRARDASAPAVAQVSLRGRQRPTGRRREGQ